VNPLYPLGLKLDGRRVLVVGGGAVATRRVPAMLSAGARVVLVSPSLTPALRALADAGRLHWAPRRFEPADVDGCWLVHVAVDDEFAAAAVTAAAAERRVFCVRADDRHAATAWTPATTRHGPVTVAVLAGGDPRRAVAIRDAIREGLTDGTLPGCHVPAPASAAALAPAREGVPTGHVALVGSGPGDPELITVKGRRLLAEADVVVVDKLAPRGLLAELDPDVEVIDAGKAPHAHNLTQAQINDLIVRRARAGQRVVRLKGGDPFVFGRGGEEALACVRAGVPVQVVPGVTSAVAVPAYAGIPVTHRGVTQDFAVVSAPLDPSQPGATVDWEALASGPGTLVLLMGVAHLTEITAELIKRGRDAATPVAVIQDGTLPGQQVLTSTLGAVADDAAAAGLRPPAVVVIGEVVRLRELLGSQEAA
jgi:uroporphyrin-III C-methyltransferase/precorrin-2 dehydrogenase/sirohydrochlorin ferrochelatase